MNWSFKLLVAFAASFIAVNANADTTDVKTQSRVLVKKMGAHCADDANCFNRYHPAIKPVLNAKPGQLLTFETRDAAHAAEVLSALSADGYQPVPIEAGATME